MNENDGWVAWGYLISTLVQLVVVVVVVCVLMIIINNAAKTIRDRWKQ